MCNCEIAFGAHQEHRMYIMAWTLLWLFCSNLCVAVDELHRMYIATLYGKWQVEYPFDVVSFPKTTWFA